MLLSIILTIGLLYIAINTKLEGDKLPTWMLFVGALITLASWQSAIVMVFICMYGLYKGVKSGEISTLNWIEDLINNV
jgi:hypothetical protein